MNKYEDYVNQYYTQEPVIGPTENWKPEKSYSTRSSRLPHIEIDHYIWNNRPHSGMTDGMTTFDLEELEKHTVSPDAPGIQVPPPERIYSDTHREHNESRCDSSQPSFFKKPPGFRSIPPPRVYRLSEELTSIPKEDIEIAKSLPIRDPAILEVAVELARNELSKTLSVDRGIKMKRRHPERPQVNQDKLPETQETQETQTIRVNKSKPVPPAKWVEYKDEDGDTYYYNKKTGKTQWEKPESLFSRN